MSKNAKIFIQEKIYTPFGKYLDGILPKEATFLTDDLD